MPQADINYLAVLVAAVIFMAVGALWYSPVLFAKPWAKLTGKKMEDMGGAATGYVVTFVAALVMSYVLAHFVDYAQADTVIEGMVTGLWIGVGFVLTASVGDYIFTNRPTGLYWINNGYPVVALMLMGGLLAIWH